MQSIQGHLSWTRQFWISWWHLSTLSLSSADLGDEQLPVPLPFQDPHMALGSAGVSVSAADRWHRDLTAIFLAFSEIPDNILRHQGAQVCESLLSALGKAEICKN